MKELFYYITGIILILSSCKESTIEAVNYNDFMIQKQDSVVSLIDSLDKLIIRRDTLNMQGFQETLISEINLKIAAIQKLEPFEENDAFKNAAISLFTSYKDVVHTKYSQVIAISMLSQLSLEKDTLDKFNRLINEINDEFSKNLEIFLIHQKEFARKNNFSLVEEIKK
jgi:hypothetical protein